MASFPCLKDHLCTCVGVMMELRHAAQDGSQLYLALLPSELRPSIDFPAPRAVARQGKLRPQELPPEVHQIASVTSSVSATGGPEH